MRWAWVLFTVGSILWGNGLFTPCAHAERPSFPGGRLRAAVSNWFSSDRVNEAPQKDVSSSQGRSTSGQLMRRLPSVDLPQGHRTPYLVRQVSYDGPYPPADVVKAIQPLTKDSGPKLQPVQTGQCNVPIDLANALALGGASHLEIQMARQRLLESHAQLTEARANWLPSFRFGVGWNKHDGRLQETEGTVLEVNRNSLFVGGGAGLGNVPLAGGSSGPMRMMVNLSLSDAIFEKRAAAWKVDAAGSAELATVNRALLEISEAYFDLLEAHALHANAKVGKDSSQQMYDLVVTFEQEGAGSKTEVDRAETELAFWEQAVEDTHRLTVSRSVNLTRMLRLDPQATLVPAETTIVPLNLVDQSLAVSDLIHEGLANRPELREQQSLVQAAMFHTRQEHWRPWLPNVQAGASAGTFGGGPSSTFENQGSRSDVDVLAVWELQNAGIGNHAVYRQRLAQLRQAQLQTQWMRDRVVTEIVTSYNDVASYSTQMETALRRVTAAGESYHLNLQRITEGEGLPIELLQAIRARVSALDAHAKSVANYNRTQYRLLRTLGRSPQMPTAPDPDG